MANREDSTCPFCGSVAVSCRVKWGASNDYNKKRVAYAYCHECNARGPLISSEHVYDVRNERPDALMENALAKGAMLAWCGLMPKDMSKEDERQMKLEL